MTEAIFYLLSSFWLGALHAATPGHGKTISAAYIVGARGRPTDALVLGVFVTLSHTAGIVLVAVLASIGAVWAMPARIEAYLAAGTALLVVGIGVWMLGMQWRLLFPSPTHTGDHGHPHPPAHEEDPEHHHDHSHGPGHAHGHHHAHGPEPAPGASLASSAVVAHRHGFGAAHTHRLDVFTDTRPSWGMLLALGVAGGLLPDPGALAILLAALASGKVILGLLTVVVFSVGFAAVLVVVGVIAARVGELVLTWLAARWLLWLQLGAALLILSVGLVLTVNAWRGLARLT
jgi:nickel/cobalt transporter (NicO) family protein